MGIPKTKGTHNPVKGKNLTIDLSEQYFNKKNFFEECLPLPWKQWPSEARIIFALIAFWSISGLLIMGSASWWMAAREMADGAYYIKRQFIWMSASWVLLFISISINLRTWLKIAAPSLLIGLVLISLVPSIGTTINGSTRWLTLGPLQIQPSELIKPFIILQAANIFGQWKRIKNEKKVFWICIFCSLILLIIKQPNLSTAALLGILLWMIALASGLKFNVLLLTAFAGSSIGIKSILTNEYQRVRVMSFINPWQDPQGSGYQLIQSLLAIGSGGWFGEGYGLSTQKLQYLPIQSTDFIYAIFAEEFGFIGSLMLIVFLASFAFISLKISLRCRNNYSKLIAMGACLILVGQSIMHIAVASGVMPTTGLPLPLVSYGGNSMISSLLIGSLLIRCSLESTGLVGGLRIQKRFN